VRSKPACECQAWHWDVVQVTYAGRAYSHQSEGALVAYEAVFLLARLKRWG
jgi:hypothetical protein